MTVNRRDALKSVGLTGLLLGTTFRSPAAAAQTEPVDRCDAPDLAWPRGIEGQRKADMGNGSFLNPLMAGDHPDPSIVKDGDDYYMTFSTFNAYPGLVIWHSKDLVNWQPIGPALTKNVGSVWAPELTKHDGRFYLYIPSKETATPGSKTTSWVIYTDDIRGEWSDPIDLQLPYHIDPGHAVGEDGSRWLFLSGGDRIRLSDDGLSTVGEVEHVYDPWRYPDDWIVEGFAPEGPKITRHGDYFYLITAVGGTAGPPTGHMVIAARSKSINGPWEQHPRNPLVRTESMDEKWWSRGHATLVEGPKGDWWGVYHGYENGFWTLGRQALLAPVTWSDDDWPEFGGGDLSQPIKKPVESRNQVHGQALSDDFSTDKYGIQWNFFEPGADEAKRITRKNGVLHLAASGVSPADGSPLIVGVGDQAYEFECDIEIDDGATAGLLLFYDDKQYCGVGFDKDRYVMHQYGLERHRRHNPFGKRLHMKVVNDRHIVSFFMSADGKSWDRFDRGMEVSGYHHNTRGGFLALKPGFYSAGEGETRFRNFRYRAL
ncbi:family 43 glycosylhydrolase [Parvularcula sp. LCG005]|uniref:family 43 glycosylhydrolase n=1 Tax=Parvularcula sp. LCG005 TaxID=3078805 RepID=UPI002943B43E|nr:family 43 glycosylhydrolase [Parvularcula sp. LCG005]WOI54668.1 family 43 glycosylhydrolase [Parvularcula sp. LCG005]